MITATLIAISLNTGTLSATSVTDGPMHQVSAAVETAKNELVIAEHPMGTVALQDARGGFSTGNQNVPVTVPFIPQIPRTVVGNADRFNSPEDVFGGKLDDVSRVDIDLGDIFSGNVRSTRNNSTASASNGTSATSIDSNAPSNATRGTELEIELFVRSQAAVEDLAPGGTNERGRRTGETRALVQNGGANGLQTVINNTRDNVLISVQSDVAARVNNFEISSSVLQLTNTVNAASRSPAFLGALR
ncbi:MAG: hypothetical protein AAF720_14050 [Pseudomonadota bacterium]